MTKINLVKNNISTAGALVLGNSIKNNPNLTQIYLSNNNISD